MKWGVFLAPQHVAEHVDQVSLADALLALSGDDKLAVAEQLLIDRAMQLSEDNKSAAARLLGLVAKRWSGACRAQRTSAHGPGLPGGGRTPHSGCCVQRGCALAAHGAGSVRLAPAAPESSA